MIDPGMRMTQTASHRNFLKRSFFGSTTAALSGRSRRIAQDPKPALTRKDSLA